MPTIIKFYIRCCNNIINFDSNIGSDISRNTYVPNKETLIERSTTLLRIYIATSNTVCGDIKLKDNILSTYFSPKLLDPSLALLWQITKTHQF
jgi:hypothetical protein